MTEYDIYRSRIDIEYKQKWWEEQDNIPFLSFKPEWKVKVIPPFRDAVVRFVVELPNGVQKSVYLDSRQSLGFWEGGKSYWEVYPVGDYVGRCDVDDVKTLMELIDE
jgi:hypothetical protein